MFVFRFLCFCWLLLWHYFHGSRFGLILRLLARE